MSGTGSPFLIPLGTRVISAGKIGIVRFVGTTQFSHGQWIGIELEQPFGKNDGSVQGVRYFECIANEGKYEPENYGLFVRPNTIKPLIQDKRRVSSVSSGSSQNSSASSSRLSTHSPSRKSLIPSSPGKTNQILSPTFSKRKSLVPVDINSTKEHSQQQHYHSPTREAPFSNNLQLSQINLEPPPPTTPQRSQSRISSRSPIKIASRLAFGTPQPTPFTPRQGSPTPTPANYPLRRGAPSPSPTRMRSISTQSMHSETSGISHFSGISSATAASLEIQLDSLRKKLRLMDSKRKEDHDKIIRLQAENKDTKKLENIVKRLQAKLTPMHDEIVNLRDKLQTSDSLRAKLVQDAAQQDEILELATLDKEMAEEKAEHLQEELDEIRAHMEVLEVEYEALKEENRLYEELRENTEFNPNSENTVSAEATIDNIRLSKKNKQLQEALLKLRDLMQEQENRYVDEIEMLKQDASSVRTVTESNDELQLQLKEAEDIIYELRAQLDDALGAEDMIESLAEKNLELTEHCEELARTIEELETLKALNDELEHNHLLTEKQLMLEFDELEVIHHANEEKLNEAEERNAYLESAIMKFRDVVTTLEADLEELKTNNQLINSDSAAMAVQTKYLMELNLKLSNTALEANSKAMDLQLRKFEAEQAISQLSIVKCYLSEGYTTDEMSINALLRLEQITFTSQVVQDFLSARTEAGTNGLIPIIPYVKILLALMDVQRYSSALAHHMRYSSPETFQKLASLYQKTELVERSLSSVTEILRNDNLQEQTFLNELEGALPKLWVLYDECMATGSNNESAYVLLLNDLTQIQQAHTFIRDIFSKITSLLGEVAIDGSSNSVLAGISSHLSSFARAKIIASKITKDVVISHDESNEIVKPNISAQISALSTKCKLFVLFFISVLEKFRENMDGHEDSESAIVDDAHSLTEEQVISIFKEQFNAIFVNDIGQTSTSDSNDNITLLITREFQDIISSLKSISLMEKDSFTKSDQPISPWTLNASKLKAVQELQAEKDDEISSLKGQLQKLSTTLKSRDKSIEELEVKVGLLNSRMTKSKEQGQAIADLRTALSEAGSQEKKLKDTVAKLRQSLLDQEKFLTNKWRKQGAGGLSDAQVQQQTEQAKLESMSAAALRHEITGLRKTINYLSKSRSNKPLVPTKFQEFYGTDQDFMWLDSKPNNYISAYNSPEARTLRQKYRSTLSDVRKSLLSFEIVSMKSLSEQSDGGLKSSAWMSRKHDPRFVVISQKDTYEKVRLIIHKLASINS